eukprot:TRINITY_DN65615_c0_g1_i1.p1 TRINITY_DN65615_c0_g1~~TRINITY_DN65615_c0_g1_i1.p1  ORF type:complete len:323 (+),score=87.18 TRINITY_DN65615_c0_g1_i1:72-971(+)
MVVKAARSLLLAACAPAAAAFTVQAFDLTRGGRPVSAMGCASQGSAPDLTLMVFAHGFDCPGRRLDCPDYIWLCSVPGLAVAVALPSDTSFSSADLGADLAFLAEELPRRSRSNTSSPFYGRLNGAVIAGGHAAGASAATVAAASPHVDGLVLFAPRRPDPISISKPLLLVAGQFDCGATSVEGTQQPLFEKAVASRKILAVASGADHCGWATAFKGACATPLPSDCGYLARADQQRLGAALVVRFARAAADHASGWQTLLTYLHKGEGDGKMTYRHDGEPAKQVLSGCPCTQTSEEAG